MRMRSTRRIASDILTECLRWDMDEKAKRLILARDRLGKKPSITVYERVPSFRSELRHYGLSGFSRKVDPLSLMKYLFLSSFHRLIPFLWMPRKFQLLPILSGIR